MTGHIGLGVIKIGAGDASVKLCSMPYLNLYEAVKQECMADSWYWKPLGVKVTFKPMNVPMFNIYQWTNHYGVYAPDGTLNELDNSHNFSTLRAALTGGGGSRGIRKHVCKGTKTIFIPWKGKNIPRGYRVGNCNDASHNSGTPYNVIHNDRGYYRTEYLMRDELQNLPPYHGYTLFFVETPFNHMTENQVLRDYFRQEQVVSCTMTYMYRTLGPKSENISISGGPFPKQKSMMLPWSRYEPKRMNLEIFNPGNFAAQCPAYDDHACDSEPAPLPIECVHPPTLPQDPIPEDPVPEDPPIEPQQSPLLFTPTVEDRTGMCPFKKNVTFE
ncbi:MAG: hypothetical protein KVP17_004075 [Porospora cf. gigantea B]|uniref:uncharacterized protein n=1 Tax=Porospora cf. gigantea B TaxID=2853592 RepID=UPI003571D6C9|nr:MAG: hypothetical protein KVP17_004075 [Porospora cf. gigantea B]